MTRAVPMLRMLLDAKGESLRYLAASALALALDFGCYSGLIRLAGVEVLAAAPIGFLLGLLAIYFLSVRWVFRARRLSDARAEFGVFAAIGCAGLALNQAVIYAGVQLFALVPELAKLVSAGIVFGFNFLSRKFLLFTRY
jgi:putative flippase GtrA